MFRVSLGCLVIGVRTANSKAVTIKTGAFAIRHGRVHIKTRRFLINITKSGFSSGGPLIRILVVDNTVSAKNIFSVNEFVPFFGAYRCISQVTFDRKFRFRIMYSTNSRILGKSMIFPIVGLDRQIWLICAIRFPLDKMESNPRVSNFYGDDTKHFKFEFKLWRSSTYIFKIVDLIWCFDAFHQNPTALRIQRNFRCQFGSASLAYRINGDDNSRDHQNRIDDHQNQIDNTIPTEMIHSEENNKTDDSQNAAANGHYPD